MVNQLCNSIINAEIIVKDLEVCHKYTKQLQTLCRAANSENTLLCPAFDDVSSAIGLCNEKIDYVQQCSKKMKVVVEYCSKISKGTYISMHICLHYNIRNK